MNSDVKTKAYSDSDASDSLVAGHLIDHKGIGHFAERLKSVIGSIGVRAFGRNCGLSEGAIRGYLSGETFPTLDRLEMIAKAAKVSSMWLGFGQEEASGGEERGAAGDTDSETHVFIPLYDAVCSAGHGSWSEGSHILAKLAFTRESLRRKGLSPSNLSAIHVGGDSMEGFLNDGDTVLIDHSRASMEVDGIYVIRMDDRLFAKRLLREWDGGCRVISTNPAYPSLTVPRDRMQELHVVGKVVWSGGWLI